MDARRALLTGLFDHAPMFPPASMSLPDALAEDMRAQESDYAWMLGRFVVPEGTDVEGRELAVVSGGTETQGERVFVEGISKIRCGGARIPSVEELAAFIRGCRERGVLFKATAGLHHAYPTAAGEHGFLNVLAASVFGDDEEALSARRDTFALDADSFRWNGRAADAAVLARARERHIHSIGSCSFFEPAGELAALGMV
ncbi:MAG TPA: hypothetical protein VFM96_03050 [Gaiellaceae bacterium]|nr:hypothetical protein [Gaiellaceae bacterium]